MAKLDSSQRTHIQGMLKNGKTKRLKNRSRKSSSKTCRSGNGSKLKY